MECPVLRKCRVCGEHKPQTDFYKLAPAKRAKKDILGVGRLSRCRHDDAFNLPVSMGNGRTTRNGNNTD